MNRSWRCWARLRQLTSAYWSKAASNCHNNILHIVDARPFSNATANRGLRGRIRGRGKAIQSAHSAGEMRAQRCRSLALTIFMSCVLPSQSDKAIIARVEGSSRVASGCHWFARQSGSITYRACWGPQRALPLVLRTLWASIRCAYRPPARPRADFDVLMPVVLHCSDGWDRTAQLASLAALLSK